MQAHGLRGFLRGCSSDCYKRSTCMVQIQSSSRNRMCQPSSHKLEASSPGMSSQRKDSTERQRAVGSYVAPAAVQLCG